MMKSENTTIEIAGVDNIPVTESLKINGPPGTGKTTQGIARVLKLIDEHDIDVSDIAWATYRRSLADDVLEEFVKKGIITREELDEPWYGRTQFVSTTHADARRLADSDAPVRDWDTVCWRDKQGFCLDQYSLPYQSQDNTSDYGSLLFDVYYWLVNNCLPMSAAHECPMYTELDASWKSHPSLTQFAEDWEAYKTDNQLVDFHEYLTHALENELYPPTKVVVIDEYHDAYPLLHEVGKMWIEAADIAIVLGDPQQVVNTHEGASPKFFEELDIPEVQLATTWRVPPVLWHAATDVLDGWHDPHEPAFNNPREGNLYEIHPPQIDYNNDTDTWQSPSGKYGTPDDLVERFAGQSMLILARTQRMVEGITQPWLDTGILFRSQVGNGWRKNDRRRHLYNALQRIRGVHLEMVKWNVYDTCWGHHAENQGRDTEADAPVYLHSSEAAALLRHTPAKYLQQPRDATDKYARHISDSPKLVQIGDLGAIVTDEFWELMTHGPASAKLLVDREGKAHIESEYIRIALVRNTSPTFELDETGENLYEDGLDSVPVAKTIHASKGSEADVTIVYDGITRAIQQAVRCDPRHEANEDRVWYVGLSRAKESVVIARNVWWWADDYLPFTLSNRTTNTALPEKQV